MNLIQLNPTPDASWLGDRRPLPPRTRLLAAPFWLVGLVGLATLTACRTTGVEAVVAPAQFTGVKSHVAVQIQTINTEDAAVFEKLFGAKRDEGSFTGVLSPAELAAALGKLKARGAEFTPMPTLITRVGKTGTAKKMREVIYPTEYDPPEVGLPAGGSEPISGETDFSKLGGFPVTPANPKSFEAREVGFRCDIETARAAGDKIGLDIDLEHSQFLGLINYGSPIYTTAKSFFGKPVEVILTDNRIEQPVFNMLRLKVALDVPPGHSIAIVGFAPDRNGPIEGRISDKERARLQADLEAGKHTLYLFTPRYSDGRP